MKWQDAELTLEAEGNRKTIVPVGDVHLNVSGDIAITTRGWGDTAIHLGDRSEAPAVRDDRRRRDRLSAGELSR